MSINCIELRAGPGTCLVDKCSPLLLGGQKGSPAVPELAVLPLQTPQVSVFITPYVTTLFALTHISEERDRDTHEKQTHTHTHTHSHTHTHTHTELLSH